ncbi:acetoacetate--CoA ligase [bacterium]|nr:acetoacetate--CoA ligase [bacterium]
MANRTPTYSPPPLWSPSAEQIERSYLSNFILELNQEGVHDHHSLYEWSLRNGEQFWREVWRFCGLRGNLPPESEPLLRRATPFQKSQWGVGATLNFAENLLNQKSDDEAVTFYGEDRVLRRLTWNDLNLHVSRLHSFFRDRGVTETSRIAAVTANTPEAIAAMLAGASLGAGWCSVAPEFGTTGILERFSQIAPEVVIITDRYFYKGREFPLTEKGRELLAALPSVHTVIVTAYDPKEEHSSSDGDQYFSYQEIVSKGKNEPQEIDFQPFPFKHPLYYLFTSGTTGKPKGIIHSAGGTLLEHMKELHLHTNIGANDVVFYQTTCAWMMWNWLISSLSLGARVVLYDGFPLLDQGRSLLEMAEREQVSVFGTNPGYLRALTEAAIPVREEFHLPSLHTVLSTGAPLLPEQFDDFSSRFPEGVRLSSISGGADIVGCFALGSPLLPVYRGELQCRSLGYHVESFDPDGNSVTEEQGELVCTEPFPSMPLGFVEDPDGERYASAYFETYPNVWHHADRITIREHGGVVVHERSDDVLNAGGVRIGPAEIYRQVLQFPDIRDALAVTIVEDGDEKIILFVTRPTEAPLSEEDIREISHRLKTEESPRHVPWKIFVAPEFPKTMSGKTSSATVRAVLRGRAVPNREALSNPNSLTFFEEIRAELTQKSPTRG